MDDRGSACSRDAAVAVLVGSGTDFRGGSGFVCCACLTTPNLLARWSVKRSGITTVASSFNGQVAAPPDPCSSWSEEHDQEVHP